MYGVYIFNFSKSILMQTCFFLTFYQQPETLAGKKIEIDNKRNKKY